MTFRRKLLTAFTLTVCVSVAAVAGLVFAMTRSAFERNADQQIAALFAQFLHEFTRQGDEVVRRVAAISASEPITRLATSASGIAPESAGNLDLAKTLAESYQLDYLEVVNDHGIIISSAQWPAKFGYQETEFENLAGMNQQGAFLKQEELEDSSGLGLFAVRAARVGENPVYVIGGRRLDKNFLSALDLPADMRVLLYQNRSGAFSPELLLDPTLKSGHIAHPAERFAALIAAVQRYKQPMTGVVRWSSDAADDEVFHAIPLQGVGKEQPLLGVLLIGSSRRAYAELKRRIAVSVLLVGSGGMVLAILLSSWVAARVTQPIVELAQAAHEVAGGNWEARVAVHGNDELSQLAESFNRMTAELLTQKQRLVQAERVAAWRELARRLAHDLKNPLFPLQITVENLIRAREQNPQQFDEVFRESAQTLLAELGNLKTIISRFSEFSKMPQPQLREISVNEVVSEVAQLFKAQLEVPGRAPIVCRLELDQNLGPIRADPELLHRALSNLVLNAMDAMPSGGTLTLRTGSSPRGVSIQVADTGSGLTPEERERVFTPYYTSKQHGTGLGLAIVQSIVSDHGGGITVHSETGRGSTFAIELPRNPAQRQQSVPPDLSS